MVVQQYAYDSFGVPYVKSGSGVSTVYVLVSSYTGSLHENTRLYTSREYDREVLLYFNRARYYSPSTGKFISRDPIGQNDQINLYTYVMNNPFSYTDLFGLKSKSLWTSYKESNYKLMNSTDIVDKITGNVANFFVGAIEGVPYVLDAAIGVEGAMAPGVDDYDEVKKQNDEYNEGVAKGTNTLMVIGVSYLAKKISTIKSKIFNKSEIDLKDANTWPKPPCEGNCTAGTPSRVKPTNRGEQSLYDENGGEWRFSPEGQSPGHPEAHWDYKPKNGTWMNYDLQGNPIIK